MFGKFRGDICYNRHRGNPESVRANLDNQLRRSEQAKQIWEFLIACGERGATCWEVEQATGLTHQTASARMSQFKADGHIVATQNRRPTVTGSQPASKSRLRTGETSRCRSVAGSYAPSA